jgi:MFS family permease
VQAIVFAFVGVGIGKAMDWNERSFHVLFPLSAVGGLIGVWIYSKVRLRGQRRLARTERAAATHHSLTMNPFSVLRVLLHDVRYRAFMIFMFIFGLGNLMLTAPLAIVLQEKFHVGYTTGILITTTIPAIIMPIAIPLWQPLMARSHIVQFRSIHGWTFVSASLIFLLAAWTMWLWLMFVAAVITGVAYAGGVLAWNLGHQDFAPPGRDSQYMGVHVTLTGIRGLMAPFLAVGIYQWFDSGGSGAGIWVFAVCLALNVVGAVGFLVLARELPQRGAPLPLAEIAGK